MLSSSLHASVLRPFPKPSLSHQNLVYLSSRRLPPRHLEKTMAGDRALEGRPGRGGPLRGRGSVSSGRSNMNMGNQSSGSIRNQSPQPSTSGTVEHGNKVAGPDSDFEVSSSWSDMNMGSTSSGSIRSQSPQPPTPGLWQSSSKTLRNDSKVTCRETDFEVSFDKSLMCKKDGSSGSSTDYARNNSPQRPRLGQTSSDTVKGSSNVGDPKSHFEEYFFDICRNESKVGVQLKKSLFEQNQEKRREREQKNLVTQPTYLRPGMILLKNHISHEDQVSIIKSCRETGIRKGGFYRPGYSDGSKLHLQMMCLGQDWDPETRLYGTKRRIDGATPPPIPDKFSKLVDGAVRAAHDFLRQKNIGDELPSMLPDICIVNFYSNSGKLGLHQDKDESEESISKGVPIVSFSVGDSADFLYGEKREVDMAGKIVLESGDVLIFGGKSRSIFHGVSSIIQNTAPKRLIEESKLKPGRLNLTFRQH